jgi:hypothetical protein
LFLLHSAAANIPSIVIVGIAPPKCVQARGKWGYVNTQIVT